MQAVFRLFKDFLGVLFKDIGGNLLAPVRRQAMQDHRVLLRQRHQLPVDLIDVYKRQGLNRAIHITGEERSSQVPVLGKVTAGLPILAVEDIEGYIPFSETQRRGRELFALRVVGESMKNAAILDGDIVVCHKTPDVKDGDIVVALLGEEATVKRFFREGDQIRLQPENPDFDPIYTKDVAILGRVISVIRYYS